MRIYIPRTDVEACLRLMQAGRDGFTVRQLKVRDIDDQDVFHAYLPVSTAQSGPFTTTGFLICAPQPAGAGTHAERVRAVTALLSGVVKTGCPAVVILCQDRPDRDGPDLSGFLIDLEKQQARPYEVHLIPGQDQLFSRTEGIIPCDLLSARKFLLLAWAVEVSFAPSS